ncbi:BZIP domain-containing protein, partial [Haematococcus lacustris]
MDFEYVKELSIRLADTDKDATASLRQPQLDLDTLVRDLSMMIMRLGVVKPLETRKFIVVSRQSLGSTEAEVINLWRNVMKLIDLSTDQKQEVVELKRLFLT